MSALWHNATLVEVAIAITLLEWLGLVLYRWATGQGPTRGSGFTWNLLSGVCLMLALHGALQAQPNDWGAGWLAASGLAHAMYLRRRWIGSRPPQVTRQRPGH